MNRPAIELVRQARYLRNAAPQLFMDFCRAFDAYRNEQLQALLDTTTDVQVAQGRAQQCQKLAQLLQEALTKDA